MATMLDAELGKQADRILKVCPLVPVITIHDVAHAVPLARALVAGGISILEVTLRTAHGLEAIRQMRDAVPEATVGAGTVLSADQYRQAQEAGAQFIISPGITDELLHVGLSASVPLIPGIATVSELMRGYALGYRTFKFFPAEVAGGKEALKAFQGPLGDVRFCPTGGIRKETAAQYLALPNVLAVGGTWLTPTDALQRGDWQLIEQIAKESLSQLQVR